MVKGSDKNYGQLMQEAAKKTESQSVGETMEALMAKFQSVIEECVNKEYERGTRGKYYIHIWVQKEPYAQNALRIYPQCRRTRPSPYQGHDHYLWSVEHDSKVTFEWCIPKKEVLTYILKHPNEFDASYVNMLRKYSKDKIEDISDYLVDGKIA
jgi:hypothetical protein